VASLRAQHVHIAEQRLAAGPAWQDLDFVFPSAVGTPLDASNVYHQFKKLLVRANLPSTHRPHDLRHSTATYCWQRDSVVMLGAISAGLIVDAGDAVGAVDADDADRQRLDGA